MADIQGDTRSLDDSSYRFYLDSYNVLRIHVNPSGNLNTRPPWQNPKPGSLHPRSRLNTTPSGALRKGFECNDGGCKALCASATMRKELDRP